jgi:membrane-bound lytic murein transglycosylase A
MLDDRKTPPPGQPFRYELSDFDDLPGWQDDDAAAAFSAFLRSAAVLQKADQTGTVPRAELQGRLAAAAALAVREADAQHDPAAARAFFEAQFQPARVLHDGPAGFLTGYFEPVLEGSLTRTDRFQVPVLRRPRDLVTPTSDVYRAATNAGLSAMRASDDGFVPYYTRAEIEDGALAGQGLELVWLDNPADAFIMHVQGSGAIRLPTGETIRIGFDGKNGHPYTSIGGLLVQRGEVPREEMSLERLRQWLMADPVRGAALMRENQSYIFFREHSAEESAFGPIGAQGVPLSEGRSLAVDASCHALGLPVFVVSEGISHHGAAGLRRLMIAQDVGSAIKGPERGDIYWGSGAEAGRLAGLTRHAGHFFVLLPKS